MPIVGKLATVGRRTLGRGVDIAGSANLRFPTELLTGLVLALNLEESSGTRYDASGNNNNALVVGDGAQVQATTGISGKGLTVVYNPGVNCLATGTLNNVPVNANWSCSVWVKLSSIAGWTSALTMGIAGANNQSWQLIQAGDTHKWYLAAFTSAGVEKDAISSGPVVAVGEWHNIFFGYDKSNTRLGIAVDGGAVTWLTGVADLRTNAAWPLGINYAAVGSVTPVNSVIDRVYMWNRFLSDADRALDYNAGQPMQVPS